MYQVLLFKFSRHLCKGSIRKGILMYTEVHVCMRPFCCIMISVRLNSYTNVCCLVKITL